MLNVAKHLLALPKSAWTQCARMCWDEKGPHPVVLSVHVSSTAQQHLNACICVLLDGQVHGRQTLHCMHAIQTAYFQWLQFMKPCLFWQQALHSWD